MLVFLYQLNILLHDRRCLSQTDWTRQKSKEGTAAFITYTCVLIRPASLSLLVYTSMREQYSSFFVSRVILYIIRFHNMLLWNCPSINFQNIFCTKLKHIFLYLFRSYKLLEKFLPCAAQVTSSCQTAQIYPSAKCFSYNFVQFYTSHITYFSIL